MSLKIDNKSVSVFGLAVSPNNCIAFIWMGQYSLRVPATFIIDRDGRLAYMKKGPFYNLNEIIAAVDDVMLGD